MELDAQRRQLQLSNDTRAAELNKLAASIGALMKQGKKDEAEQAKQQVAALKGSRRMWPTVWPTPNAVCARYS